VAQVYGTGFVFAMWMARAGALETLKNVDFAAARDEGLQQVETIVSHYEEDIPLTREEIRKYLTHNITFQVDESLNQGMRLYF